MQASHGEAHGPPRQSSPREFGRINARLQTEKSASRTARLGKAKQRMQLRSERIAKDFQFAAPTVHFNINAQTVF
jgi:hypothetical protein